MNYIWQILSIAGALAFFIYGMKVMSEAIQRAAGDKLRNLLGLITSNRYTGVLTGFFITALLQSSSATTVMTVSFVNAGLLTLVESGGVMMGANIGTTITGWIVSLIGLKVKISTIALPVLAVGFVLLMATKRQRQKDWGEFLIGFALLFMGLAELKDQVPDLRANPELLDFFLNIDLPDILMRIIYMLVGALFTIIVQSSSASMSITIILVNQGLPLEIGAAMVLGENIGTTITAELASLVANHHAKRSARIHTLFNVVGVVWMLIMLPYFLDFLSWLIPPPEDGGANQFALAMFHTFFNLANVALLIGFLPFMVNQVKKMISAPDEPDLDKLDLSHLSTADSSNTSVALIETRQEIERFPQEINRGIDFLKKVLSKTNKRDLDKVIKRISQVEEHTDYMEEEITRFIFRIYKNKNTEREVIEMNNAIKLLNHYEKVGDILYSTAFKIRKKNKGGTFFEPELRTNIEQLIDVTKKHNQLSDALSHNRVSNEEIEKVQGEMNNTFKRVFKDYAKDIADNKYDTRMILNYRDIISSLERINDHLSHIVHIKMEMNEK